MCQRDDCILLYHVLSFFSSAKSPQKAEKLTNLPRNMLLTKVC
ncbi:hypothetical protein CUS_7974 [Ruminococcus albus 8]|uniref:Uncharacterized protein n=1 Tax=Ruminococcus albus 8 TaxID=246199 RepID=E9SAL2_RUMAL|nr:hypothetical protein CUS_7974 [Ruminococcus albus 8]